MRAVVIDRFGPPERLRVAELPPPAISEDELLVRVRAAGVNTIDWKTRAGGGVPVDDFPAVLGWDLSGEVVAPTSGRDDGAFRPGDEVFGLHGFPDPGRCYAEYVAVPPAELCRKPMTINHVDAAALPMVALTGWQALFALGGLDAGMTLLIHGAAGGVGHVSVQLGSWAGARVVGSASAHSTAMLRELGASRVVAYDRLEEAARDADVVLDTRGGADLAMLVAAARPGTTIVSLLGRDNAALGLGASRGIRVEFAYVKPDAAMLAHIAELVAGGWLRPAVHATFPLEAAADAHRIGELGHVQGKLVLDVDAHADPMPAA
jgi:NADPH:quinone reductase-like Zn-dependent oxidoreductase